MSVDQAFRKMIRREVETQLRPLQHAVTELGVLRALAERLQPIANFLGGAPFGASLALRRGPGRPPGSVKAKGRRGRRPTGANDRPCAIIGCGRPSRTKGYCAAHYQKLRMLIRTKRRPSAWSDYAPADSVKARLTPGEYVVSRPQAKRLTERPVPIAARANAPAAPSSSQTQNQPARGQQKSLCAKCSFKRRD